MPPLQRHQHTKNFTETPGELKPPPPSGSSTASTTKSQPPVHTTKTRTHSHSRSHSLEARVPYQVSHQVPLHSQPFVDLRLPNAHASSFQDTRSSPPPHTTTATSKGPETTTAIPLRRALPPSLLRILEPPLPSPLRHDCDCSCTTITFPGTTVTVPGSMSKISWVSPARLLFLDLHASSSPSR